MSITESPTTTLPDPFAANLKRVIEILMAANGKKPGEMRSLMHVSRGTWYNRMADGEWSARQMVELAKVLDTSVETLYGSPDELVRSRCFAPLALVNGLGDQEDATSVTDAIRPTLTVVPS